MMMVMKLHENLCNLDDESMDVGSPVSVRHAVVLCRRSTLAGPSSIATVRASAL